MSKILEVEVYRKDKAGTSTTLKLPATPFKIADTFDKLRMTDTKAIYQMELLGCKLNYLSPHISENASLYDLNHLAQRLAVLTDWEMDCFEGLVQMDAEKTESAPIPLERLDTEDNLVTYKAMIEAAPGEGTRFSMSFLNLTKL